MRFLLIPLLFVITANAQIDTAMTVPLLGIQIGGQIPYGDLQHRFGPNLRAGGAFLIKTKTNWVYGLEAGYLFGRNVREDVLVNLENEDGFVIDNEGFPADLRVTQRGLTVHLTGGKVLSLWSANPNSGLLIMVGAGVMQHRIKLYDAQQNIAAVKGDLAKGYDRFTAGFSASQFIGYLFLSEYRLVNFYAGFEFYEGFTKSVRKFNYDTGLPDTAPRFDVLAGFRFGWVLPLYKKRPDEFYYY